MLVGLFLRKYAREAAICGLLLYGVAMCRSRDSYMRAEGAAQERARYISQELTKYQDYSRALQDSIRVDTVRLTRTITEMRELRDTLVLTDTIQVLRYIARCDSVATACQRAVDRMASGWRADSIAWTAEKSLLLTRIELSESGSALRGLRKWIACGPGYGITNEWEPRVYVGCMVDVWP